MMPYLLLATLTLVAMYYNQGGLFYLTWVCWLAYLLPGWTQGMTEAQLWLLWSACCVILALLGLISERGLLSFAGWLTHLVVLGISAVAYGLQLRYPDLVAGWLNPQWLPPNWFRWTSLNQWSLLLWLMVFMLLLLWFIKQQRRRTFDSLLGLLLLAVLFHVPDSARDMTQFAGLLCFLFSALQKSWHLAYVDELTGLPGRRALQEKLQRSLGIYALAMVDVDHFKKFNDNYGHDVGDDVLRMIAAKINQVTGGGKAYRYGGEEFTIVFNNHSAKEIKDHLQAVIDAVADTPFVVNRRKNQKPKTVQVTISIGLTDSIHKANADETIKTADQALYTAKKKGRNRLQLKAAS